MVGKPKHTANADTKTSREWIKSDRFVIVAQTSQSWVINIRTKAKLTYRTDFV